MNQTSMQPHSTLLLNFKDQTQKLLLTHVYYPILAQHYFFERKWEEADAPLGRNPLTGETLPFYIEAMQHFDFHLMRSYLTEVPSVLSKLFFEAAQSEDFFESRHPEIKPVFDRFAAGISELQWARSSLQSFTRPLMHDLAEMEKSSRQIDAISSQLHDKAANLRGCMAGGSIGMAVGTLVFPGIGTALGVILGGYWMQKSRHSGYYERITQNITLYGGHTNHLVGLLHDHARELYMIIGKMFDLLITERIPTKQ